MSMYIRIIEDATGERDPKGLREIEDIMRHDIFHSTLDWLTKDELVKAAKDAIRLREAMKTSPAAVK